MGLVLAIVIILLETYSLMIEEKTVNIFAEEVTFINKDSIFSELNTT